jgi:hypothetical protein
MAERGNIRRMREVHLIYCINDTTMFQKRRKKENAADGTFTTPSGKCISIQFGRIFRNDRIVFCYSDEQLRSSW